MKALLLFVLLFAFQVTTFAGDCPQSSCQQGSCPQSNYPPDEPQSVLNADAIGAVKAILAKPTEAAAFSANTELMKVTVTHQALSETLYKFEGKKVSPGGYRSLFILKRTGFVGDVGQAVYEATLQP